MPAGHRTDSALFALLFVLLTFAVFATAGPLWHWTYLVIATFVVFTCWALLKAFQKAPPPGVFAHYRVLLLLSGAALGYATLKSLPIWPAPLMAVLSPNVVESFRVAGIDGWNGSGLFALSIDAGLALREFLRTASYFAIFVLVLVLVRTRTQARWLAYGMLVVISSITLWALWDYLVVGLGRGRARGNFQNANLLAGFIELGIGLAGGLLYAQPVGVQRHSWRGRVVGAVDWLMSWRAGFIVLFIMLLGALFATGSRGGTLSIVAALLVSATLLLRQRRSIAESRRLIGVLVLLTAMSVTWLGADVLLKRVGEGRFEATSRLSYYRSALQMATDYPLFGMGGGSWIHAYSQYRDPALSPSLVPVHTHNDHLQMLAEHGVIGYLLFGTFVLTALRALVRTLNTRHDRFVRGITFGSLAATQSLLFHAFIDNNFQVTVTMAYFFAILGLGLAAARLPSARRREALE